MNLCSAKEETRANGRDMLQQDLKRMELPFVLETPNEDEGYTEEIRMVKSWIR